MEKNKTSLKSFSNTGYHPGSKVKILCWLIVSSLFFRHSLAVFGFIKAPLLRLFGARVGTGLVMKPSVNIKYPWLLKIGNDVWIGENVWIDNLASVELADNVCISQGAMLLTGNHNYKKPTFDLLVGKIVLQEGCWIGAMSVVCPGVTCQSHAILTVGSVATGNLLPYTIYQGNPAVAVRQRVFDFEPEMASVSK